jgi:hypothetical protein
LTKAGVAAVTPLLGADNLFEAITTGRECPPGMMERMMERIERHEKAARSPSRRAASVRRGGWVLPAGIVAVLAVGLAGAWWLAQGQGQAVQRVQPAKAGTSANAETPPVLKNEDKPVHIRWSFEKGPAADLQVLQGEWKWKFSPETQSGCMVGPETVPAFVKLPIKLSHRSIRIRLNAFYNSEGYYALGSMAMLDGKEVPHLIWRSYFDITGASHADFYKIHIADLYLFDRYYIDTIDGDAYGLQEFANPHPADTVLIGIRRWCLQSIEIDSITPEEIPASLRDIPGLIQRMQEGPFNVDSNAQSTSATPAGKK